MNEKIKIRNTLLLNELDKIDKVFLNEGIRCFVIKGASLILKDIFGIDEREMSDVDLFVERNDFKKVEVLLYRGGFKKIERGYNSFYKEVGQMFAPVVFDLHYDFLGIRYLDVDKVDVGYKAIKAASLVDDFIIISSHSIVRHGFIDKRILDDITRVYKKGSAVYEDFSSKVVLKSKRLKLGYITWLCFKKIGVDLKHPNISIREFFSIPFVRIAFYKYIRLNEYILPIFYDKELLKDEFRKWSRFWRIKANKTNKVGS